MTTSPRFESGAAATPAIEVRDLTMTYDRNVVMQGLNFQVRRGEVFVIMGGSGSGKSTLLKHLIGLKQPAQGTILFDNEDFSAADGPARKLVLGRMGVLYQNGALWSGLTLAENVAQRAIQVFGAMGVSQDTPMASMWKLSRIMRIADGPDEVHMSQLAKLTIRQLVTTASAPA